MHLNNITKYVNERLAGETLMYSQMILFLDSVIDDINAALNSCYPSFSDFTSDCYPKYPNYNFFPDRYIRSVVILGAAYKFYVTDEEGIQTAQALQYEYQRNLFLMQRDFSLEVPEAFQNCGAGMLASSQSEQIIIDWSDL